MNNRDNRNGKTGANEFENKDAGQNKSFGQGQQGQKEASKPSAKYEHPKQASKPSFDSEKQSAGKGEDKNKQWKK